MRRLTIVAYAVNGSGLGHLTRVTAILRWVRRLGKLVGVQPDIYILTSSEASALAFEEGFAAFKIPSKTAIRLASIQKEDYLRLAKQWVWHSLGLLRPDILLVDTFPGGSFGELFHALDGTGSKVFIHRAMKDVFSQQEVFQAMLPLYDRILVPEEPGQIRTELSSRLAARTRYLGPILLRDRVELHSREKARRRLGIPEASLGIWISAGGGGDPKAAQVLQRLVETLRAELNVHLVIGAGPLFRGEPIRGANITWVTEFNAVLDFPGLDCAFSAAGFNSYHELLHAGVPTAFFGQEKIADEQSRRVERAVKAGAARLLKLDASGIPEPSSIVDMLTWFRDPENRSVLGHAASEFVPRNWAQEAAFEVLATQLPKSQLEDALELGTPEFFYQLDQLELDFDLVQDVLKELGPASEVDGSERRDLFFELIDQAGARPETTARHFLALVKRMPKLTDETGAQDRISAAIRVIERLNPFDDDRGATAFLRLLPAERQPQADQFANQLSLFLESLHVAGESLWRGMAILSRHQDQLPAGSSFLSVLDAARKEVEK
ncbi:MAG TPA: hypothetical protein PLS70_05440 [Acidobacteriota bacterium]|nr:hypothetical protein [Acidobacteriota bacterium]